MGRYNVKSARGSMITVIGGGTGLSTMLRGLKKRSGNLTAIVTVADDGGGSGVLRKELGMPPPGDVRNCIQALANAEPVMEELLAYRFTEGSLKGQSFGNLFLAALTGMSGSFDEAVQKMSDVLAITGRVLPVSNEDVTLIAEFQDGSTVRGESAIQVRKSRTRGVIKSVRLEPEHPQALGESIDAIERAEFIVLGPGSLYTSIMPNLLTEGVVDAIMRSQAVKVYVLNVMTQTGETEGYTASDHIKALFGHAGGRRIFDYCLANSLNLSEEVLARYRAEGAEPIIIDEDAVNELGVEVIKLPVADIRSSLARHDSELLADALMNLMWDKIPARIYEYGS